MTARRRAGRVRARLAAIRLTTVSAIVFAVAWMCCASADDEVPALVRQLGAATFEERESAEADLLQLGAPRVATAIMGGLRSQDPEVAIRCARLRRRMLLGIDGETAESTIALLENMHKEGDPAIRDVALRKLMGSRDGVSALRTVLALGKPVWARRAAEVLHEASALSRETVDAHSVRIALLRAWADPGLLPVAVAARGEVEETIALTHAWETLDAETNMQVLRARLVYATGDVAAAADAWTGILSSAEIPEETRRYLDCGLYAFIEAGRWDSLCDVVTRHWPEIAVAFGYETARAGRAEEARRLPRSTIVRDCVLATALHLAERRTDSDRLLDALTARCPDLYETYLDGMKALSARQELRDKEEGDEEDFARLFATFRRGDNAGQALCSIVDTLLLCGRIERGLELADRYNMTQIMLGMAHCNGTRHEAGGVIRARGREDVPELSLRLPSVLPGRTPTTYVPGTVQRRNTRLDRIRKLVDGGDVFGARAELSRVHVPSPGHNSRTRMADLQQMLELELALGLTGQAHERIRRALENGMVDPDPNAVAQAHNHTRENPRELWEVVCPHAALFDLSGPGGSVDERMATVILAAKVRAQIADADAVAGILKCTAEAMTDEPVLKTHGAIDRLIDAFVLAERYHLQEMGDGFCDIYAAALRGIRPRPLPEEDARDRPIVSSGEWFLMRATLASLVRRGRFDAAAEVCTHVARLVPRNLASYLYARAAFQMARLGAQERAQDVMALATVLVDGAPGPGPLDRRPLYLACLAEGAFPQAVGQFASQQLLRGGRHGPASRATTAECLPEDVAGQYESSLRVRRCGMFVLLLPVVGPYGLRDQSVRALSFRWLYLANAAMVRAHHDTAAIEAIRDVAEEVLSYAPGAGATTQFVTGCLDALGKTTEADAFFAKAAPACDAMVEGRWADPADTGLKERFRAVCGRDLEETIETCRNRLEGAPHDYARWGDTLALALLRAGRREEALAVRERAVRSFLMVNPPAPPESAWLPDYFIPLTAYVSR